MFTDGVTTLGIPGPKAEFIIAWVEGFAGSAALFLRLDMLVFEALPR